MLPTLYQLSHYVHVLGAFGLAAAMARPSYGVSWSLRLGIVVAVVALMQALQVAHECGVVRTIGLQRFRGSLGGKRETFVLQGSEMIKQGRIEATWFVVPDSGTDGFVGLRGEGGFDGQFGTGSKGYIDYWFE